MISVFILNTAEAISEPGNPAPEMCFHGMNADKRGWFQLFLKVCFSCSGGLPSTAIHVNSVWKTPTFCKIVRSEKVDIDLILLSNYDSTQP